MLPEKQTCSTHNLYEAAFALHGRMNEFLSDFGDRRGWRLLASLLKIRYSSAFTAFLDQPTASRLSAVLSFDDEMTTLGVSMPPTRPGNEQPHR